MRRKYLVVLVVALVGVVGLGMYATPAKSIQDVYWEGQEVEISSGVTANDVYLLYKNDGDKFVREIKANDSGTLTIDTGKFGEGKFVVYAQDGTIIKEYTVSVQRFDVELDNNTVFNGNNTNFSINSARAEFDVFVSAESVSSEELNNAFLVNSSRKTELSDGVLRINSVTAGENIEIDTSELPKKQIEFKWNVTDTVDEENITLVTTRGEVGSATFTNAPMKNNVGDNVVVNLSLEDTRRVEVQIGRETYRHNVTLRDTDNDSKVSFKFNSFFAGNSVKPVSGNPGTEVVKQETDLDVPDDTLATGTYTTVAKVRGQVTDVATLTLSPIETNGIDILELPGNTEISNESVHNNTTLTNQVARGDRVVVAVRTSSIHGLINRSVTATQLSPNSTFSDNYNLSLEVLEEEARINREKREVPLSDARYMFSDGQRDTLYLVFDAEDFPGEVSNDRVDKIDVINRYDVKFRIDKDARIVNQDTLVETNDPITITEDTVIPQNRRNEDGEFVLSREKGRIPIKTSLADGREVSTIVEGAKLESSSLATQTVQNGTLNYTIDTGDLQLGRQFMVDVLATNEEYEFVVGTDDVIESVKLPSNISSQERFNVRVNLRDEFEDDNLTVTVAAEGRQSKVGDNVSFRYASDGLYNITITAEDEDGTVKETVVRKLNVSTDIPQPKVDLSSNASSVVFTGETIRFTTVKALPDRFEPTYDWTVNNQSVGSESELTYRFNEPGRYSVGLSVTNREDESATESTTVTVYEGNEAVRRMYSYLAGPN